MASEFRETAVTGWREEPGFQQASLLFSGGPSALQETSRRIPPVPSGSQLILDLETKVGFDQIRGRSGIRGMGMSVAVTYAYADDRFRTYFEQDAHLLIEDLFAASRTIGFNIRRFDYEVLRAYTRRTIRNLPTLDLLDEIQLAAGHRVSLESLLKQTLQIGKAGHGGMAIDWYESGDWKRLEEYCRQDVRVTKALYEYGRRSGSVSFWDRRRARARSVSVRWSPHASPS